jgi:hypothetical protein
MSENTTIGPIFNPTVGIERIIESNDGPGSALLPPSARVVPTDAATGQEALHRLYSSAWEGRMRRFLQPQVTVREMLIPGKLANYIRRAHEELTQEARRKKSSALRQAALLMEEDEDMKNLLEIYRNLLLPG